MTDLQARAFVKRGAGLFPSDVFAEEFVGGLKDGREILLSARRARNPAHHRKLFALLRKVTDNSERWANEAVLLEDLKLATGLFTTRVNEFNGMPYPVPASISFAAMPQDEFSRWYERAIVVLADILGCTPAELDSEVEAMVHDRSAA